MLIFFFLFFSLAINTLLLPPNTTHLLQPLDKYVFASFKTILKQEIGRLQGALRDFHGRCQPVMMQALWNAMRRAFNDAKAVRRSFRECGLSPLDTDLMREIASKERQAESGLVACPTWVKDWAPAHRATLERLQPSPVQKATKITELQEAVAYTSCHIQAKIDQAREAGRCVERT